MFSEEADELLRLYFVALREVHRTKVQPHGLTTLRRLAAQHASLCHMRTITVLHALVAIGPSRQPELC